MQTQELADSLQARLSKEQQTDYLEARVRIEAEFDYAFSFNFSLESNLRIAAELIKGKRDGKDGSRRPAPGRAAGSRR